MDSKLGCFTSIDPKAEKYYGISPYAYCAGDPVNCIDKDGKKVVMINGYYPFPSETGNARYWKGTRVALWANQLNKQSQSQEITYLDGSIGSKVINYGGKSLVCENRIKKGAIRGERDAADLISSLKRDDSGIIIEPLIVITHSMGAAYAKGYLSSIVNYAKENGIEGLEIYEFDFAPHQPTEQTAVAGVYTYQISHKDDDVVDNANYRSTQGEISGAIQVNSSSDEEQEHSISTFTGSVTLLQRLFNGLIHQ